MPLFRRRPPKPLPPPSFEMPAGEEVERSVRAQLLDDGRHIRGILYMTNRRLVFEAAKGDARWMIVPYQEVREAGLFRHQSAPMGVPSSLAQCLFIKTTKGEHVWWDFDEAAEREWLPLVQAHVARTRPEDEEPPD